MKAGRCEKGAGNQGEKSVCVDGKIGRQAGMWRLKRAGDGLGMRRAVNKIKDRVGKRSTNRDGIVGVLASCAFLMRRGRQPLALRVAPCEDI